MIIALCSTTTPTQCPYTAVNGTPKCLEHAEADPAVTISMATTYVSTVIHHTKLEAS